MSKYNKVKKEPLSHPIPIRFEQRAIDEVADIHNIFAEFVRDALDEKLVREQAILEKLEIIKRGL